MRPLAFNLRAVRQINPTQWVYPEMNNKSVSGFLSNELHVYHLNFFNSQPHKYSTLLNYLSCKGDRSFTTTPPRTQLFPISFTGFV
jgi:hypothetical protein